METNEAYITIRRNNEDGTYSVEYIEVIFEGDGVEVDMDSEGILFDSIVAFKRTMSE